MQRFTVIFAVLLASMAVAATNEALGEVDQGTLHGAVLRLLGDEVIIIETSDETNETETEEQLGTTGAPEERSEPETTGAPETPETPETPEMPGMPEDGDAESVLIGGSLEIAAAEPQVFCDDSGVQAAVKAAIATAAQADATAVQVQCRVERRLMGGAAQRRLTSSAVIEYTVYTTSELLDYLRSLDEEAWTTVISEALVDAGRSDLIVTVVHISLPTVQVTTMAPTPAPLPATTARPTPAPTPEPTAMPMPVPTTTSTMPPPGLTDDSLARRSMVSGTVATMAVVLASAVLLRVQ